MTSSDQMASSQEKNGRSENLIDFKKQQILDTSSWPHSKFYVDYGVQPTLSE